MKITTVAVVLASLLHTVVTQQMSADKAAAQQISTASNEFANKLFEEIGRAPGNVLVCPISLHVALALVYLGAGGRTATQLATVTNLSRDITKIKEGYRSLLTGIEGRTLTIATKLYPAAGYPLNEDYVGLAREYFLSDVEGLNFNNPLAAANIINQYVERQTNNNIHNLISPDSLSAMTRLVIINAVHFQATWKKTFEKAYDAYFKVSPEEKIMTRMMTQTDYFEYKEDLDLQAKILKMDYTEGNYSMIFVLPLRENGLPEVETKLTHTSLPTLLRGLKESRVEVTIPKFSLEMTINLKEILTKMGITDLFSSRANLNGISSEEKLFVSEAIQKTFINVHENGTEASAATGFLETLSAIPDTHTFSARKPFHFYVIKSQHQPRVLFEGRFQRPKKFEGSEDDSFPVPQQAQSQAEQEYPTFHRETTTQRTPSKNNYPGNANGNQKPDNDNRYPASQRPQVLYTPQQYQPNVNYDRFASPSTPQTYRPLSYNEYQAQLDQQRRQTTFF